MTIETIYRIDGVDFKQGQKVEITVQCGAIYGESDTFTCHLEWAENNSLGFDFHDIGIDEIISIKAI